MSFYLKREGSSLPVREFSLREIIRTRQFWLLSTSLFAFLFCLYTITVHIVIHATGLGISATSTANVLATIGGLSIAGNVIIGIVSDRIGPKLSLIISFALMAVALLWLQLATELWGLYLFAVIFGFAMGGAGLLFSPLTAELFGLASLGAIQGITNLVGAVGITTGPLMAGVIFDLTTSYNLVFWICVGLCVVALIGTSLLRLTATKGEEK